MNSKPEIRSWNYLIIPFFIAMICLCIPLNAGAVSRFQVLHVSSDGDANNSKVFTDDSPSAHVVKSKGKAKHENPFGSDSAIVFNGKRAYLKLAKSSDWDFGTGNFTIDLWVNFAKRPHNFNGIFTAVDSKSLFFGSGYRMDIVGGTIRFFNSGSLWLLDSGVKPAVNAWYHLAIVRDGDVLTLYVNGNTAANTDCSGMTFDSSGKGLQFGKALTNKRKWFFNGHMDEITVTKGEARWHTDFTPPDPPDGGGHPPDAP